MCLWKLRFQPASRCVIFLLFVGTPFSSAIRNFKLNHLANNLFSGTGAKMSEPFICVAVRIRNQLRRLACVEIFQVSPDRHAWFATTWFGIILLKTWYTYTITSTIQSYLDTFLETKKFPSSNSLKGSHFRQQTSSSVCRLRKQENRESLWHCRMCLWHLRPESMWERLKHRQKA